jgi:hypothetical protein
LTIVSGIEFLDMTQKAQTIAINKELQIWNCKKIEKFCIAEEKSQHSRDSLWNAKNVFTKHSSLRGSVSKYI